MGHQLQLKDEILDSTREAIDALTDLLAVVRHYGPGPHPGTGTSQDVHGSGGGAAPSVAVLSPARQEYLQEVMGMWNAKEPKLEAWRERNARLIAGSTEVLENFGKEMESVWMRDEGEQRERKYGNSRIRFIIAPDGRIFMVEDHDEVADAMRVKALTGKLEFNEQGGIVAYGDPRSDENPDSDVRFGYLQLERQFNVEGVTAIYPKDEMVNMGFIRGSISYGPPEKYTELGIQLATPVEPGARRTIREFIDTHEEDEIRFDVNLGPARFSGSRVDTLKTIIKRSEEEIEERHYGPGPHPGTGTSQDVHGSGGGARATIQTNTIDGLAVVDSEREEMVRQWRFDYQDIMDATIEVLERSNNAVEVEYPEGLKKYLSGKALARFLISPDGRIWSVDDHDIVAEEVQSRFMTGDRLGSTATDVNPDKEEMRAFDKLHGWHTDNYNPKNELIAMGFVRGSLIDELGISMQFMTPLEPAVRRTAKDFLEIYEEQSFVFDINFGEEAFVTQNPREAKLFIRRFLEERHYGPGVHPGTGTDQSVHGDVATRSLQELQAEAGRLLQTGPSPATIKTVADMDSGRYFIGPDGTLYKVSQWSTHISTGYKVTDALGDELKAKFGEENLHHSLVSDLGFIRMIAYVEDDGGHSPSPGWENAILLDVSSKPTRKQVESIEDMLLYHDAKTKWDYSIPDPFGEFASTKHETGTGIEALKRIAGVVRHYGPGPHSGTGTSQDVHGSGDAAPDVSMAEINRQVDAIEEYLRENYEEVRSPDRAYQTDGWMDQSGTLWSIEPLTHWESSLGILEETGVWDAEKVKRGRQMERGLDPNREMVSLGFVRFHGSMGGTSLGFTFIDFPELTRGQRESMAVETQIAWEVGYEIGAAPLAGAKLGVPDWYETDELRQKLGLTERHYGPGPHPGTGTSQDVHGGNGGPRAGKVQMTSTSRKQSGLGEFRIDRPAPSQNNSIVFDDEELRSKGYSDDEIAKQREWFFENVSKSIIEMEDILGIEIKGIEITNSVIDLAERQAGPLVMGNPSRREAFLGRMREETVGWLGGYYKGVVWLDDNHKGELLSSETDLEFRSTINHEVSHYLAARDGRAKFGPEYVISMSNGTYPPTQEYIDAAKRFYGTDKKVIGDEYRADLIASYTVFNQEWIRDFFPDMTKKDKANQENIISALQNEARFVNPNSDITTRAADESEDVLVFFKRVGEIRGVPRSALRNLPKDAVVLSQVFKK